ncbi:SGNH/GDSL hydrolase family protein [Archangium lansingense]|uniref:SGNH/GDSL hydrolase family protein n=1 Tax=Archangium lansingense TaxID=2995310 RepID=A0ABT4A3A4_9BACT|nr:SGNH/GDSL hydrolase family protein [Archangium lansinium]MCY1076126.1 SGNH/GDSL hydrolase family protein [Archangium lansinium]
MEIPSESPPPEQPPSALTWVTVPPSEPRLQYTGRVDVSAASAVFSYSGVSLKVRFRGDALELLLNEQGPDDRTTTNYYQVTLDEQAPVKLAVRASQTVYEIARNLPLGEHTVELIKLTESDVGRSELRGLRIHGELLDPPARPSSRIEFIGDSITCGYGNEVSIPASGNPGTGFHSVNQNITRAYGALTARTLGAEAVMVCNSGRGIYRNNTGETGNTVPHIYNRVLPNQDTPRWDFTRAPPDHVVLNLGTNDFYPGTPSAPLFQAAYEDFVTRLRSQYPQARIICAVGPMLSDEYPAGQFHWSTLQSWVSSLVKGFNDRGDARVHYLAFTPQSAPYGEDWHPSAATHEAMATRLTEFIRSLK